jgi:RHS repeat-associated protein
VRGAECASTQNSSKPRERIFFISPQTRTAPSKNGLRYDNCASGRTFYNHWRYFDPATGRYTQSDPIGLAGGSFSTYNYVNSAATMFTDPMGLQVLPFPPPPIPGVPNLSTDAQRQLAEQLTRATQGNEDRQKTYQTYTRYNPVTGQCYTGRTSGYGTPEENIRNRSYGQPLLNFEGFLPPVLDRSSTNYNSIRGREQLVMDLNGGARSTGGTSRNAINGISTINPLGRYLYIPAANAEFGVPVPAGQCQCQ